MYHETVIAYQVALEGAEEATAKVEELITQTKQGIGQVSQLSNEAAGDIEGLLTDVSKGIGLVSSLDYTLMAWQRTAESADIMGFMRATLSTINLIRQLISVTELATIAQQAYNAALAIGSALSPFGLAMLMTVGTATAITAYSALQPQVTPAEPRILTVEEFARLKEIEEKERYESIFPG